MTNRYRPYTFARRKAKSGESPRRSESSTLRPATLRRLMLKQRLILLPKINVRRFVSATFRCKAQTPSRVTARFVAQRFELGPRVAFRSESLLRFVAVGSSHLMHRFLGLGFILFGIVGGWWIGKPIEPNASAELSPAAAWRYYRAEQHAAQRFKPDVAPHPVWVATALAAASFGVLARSFDQSARGVGRRRLAPFASFGSLELKAVRWSGDQFNSGGTAPYVRRTALIRCDLRATRHRAGRELPRELDARLHDLRAGRRFEIAVRREPRFVAAAVGTEGLFGRHVADDPVGQFDRERERKRARLLDAEAVLDEVLRRVRHEHRRADLNRLHFDLDPLLLRDQRIEQQNLFGEGPRRRVALLGPGFDDAATGLDPLRSRNAATEIERLRS